MNMLQRKDIVDRDLEQILCDRIKWDKRVSLADLNIVVRGGVVIVSGYVDTSYKKAAALEVITETEGVWSLEDRIIVPSDYVRTDDEILKIIKAGISELTMLGGEHIEVDVVEGIVKLEGEVFRPRLKAHSVALAWELSGVRDVLNFIEIRHPPFRPQIEVLEEPNFDKRSLGQEVAGENKEVSA